MLNANEGSIIKAVAKRSLMNNSFRPELVLPGPGNVKTTKIPITPKTIDAQMNTLVAIFCIVK